MKKILLFASAVAVLFSSCSTDKTEDIVGVGANGTIRAYADQQIGTRTEMDSDGNVLWSKGDAIGVFGEAGPQVQFGLTAGEGTADGTFSGNTNFLKVGEAVTAYYPFTKGTTITEGKLPMEIMAEQTYLPTDAALGSFDAAQAPSVAFIEKLASKTDPIELNFKGVASYLVFPVQGLGTLETLTLSIYNGVEKIGLAGPGYVDLTKWPTDEDIADAEKDEDAYADLAFQLDSSCADEITLQCGAIELKPYEPVMLQFVVPAGINIDETSISLTAVVDGEEFNVTRPAKVLDEDEDAACTARNQWDGITNNGDYWTFGLEGKYVIDSDTDATNEYDDKLTAEERFLAYAYLTRPGQASTTDYSDYIYAAAALDLDAAEDIATIEALVFANVLDFTTLDAVWAQEVLNKAVVAENNAKDDEKAAHTFWKNVYTWYKENGAAIESLSYNAVIGNPIDKSNGNFATIKNLTVKGNGVSAGASLKNLAFEAVTVETDAESTYEYVGLIAGANNLTATDAFDNTNKMVIENVYISADNVVKVNHKATGVGAIYGLYVASNKNTISAATKIALELNAKVANVGRLYGVAQSSFSMELGSYSWDESVEAYPVIGWYKSTGILESDLGVDIVGVDDEKNAGVVGNVASKGSIIVAGTSYWNGSSKEDDGKAPFTAEELAYVLRTEKTSNIAMSHNIDMQNNVITLLPSAARKTNIENEEVYEISNINAKVTGSGYASLFGYNANVENLTVSNLAIKTEGANLMNGVAGLAYTGTAKNVTINSVAIDFDAATKFGIGGANVVKNIGGVFAVANTNTNAFDNVEVKAAEVKAAVNSDEVDTNDVKFRYGIMAGTLNVTTAADPITLGITKITGAKSAYNATNVNAAQQGSATEYKTSENYGNAYYPYGVIEVQNPQFVDNGYVKAELNVNEASVNNNSARMAAGIVFNWTVATDAKVGHDASVKYPYSFITNAPINKSYTVWGFTPAE